MASYADLLRIAHGRYVGVGELAAVSKERLDVVSPAVEALIEMGTLRRLPDRRLTSTKATLGDLTKLVRDRGGDPNAPLPVHNEHRVPLEVAAEPNVGSAPGEEPRRAKCPLCKAQFAAIAGDRYCPQCGAYLHIAPLD